MVCTSSLALVLLGLCLSRPGIAGEPASTPRSTTPQAQQVVDRAIRYLQTESAAWLKTHKCAACHHVPMPLWALAEAERQGYAIDKKFVADTVESLLGSMDKLMASRIFPNPADPADPRPQGRGLNMGLPMLAVAARSLPSLSEGQKQSLQLIAGEIVKKQQPDGSWEFFATLRRPPINESQTTDAAWIVIALQGETGPDAPKAQREALSKGTAWLNAAKHSDLHQDKALKVLLAVRSGKPRKTMQTTIDELLALQRADGGWSQTVPDPKSDAFATGQTLYVLSLAGFTAERPEIKRGIDFLVATQKPDGSWPMISRSTPDGSPGSSKLLTPITCAASSWATLGLARLVPKEKPASKADADRNAQKVPTKIAGTLAADQPAWQATLGDLVKTEKAGFGGLCGVVVEPANGTVWINISDRGFYRSDDQGKTFRRGGDKQPKGRTESPGCLLLDPTGASHRLVTAMVYGSPVSVSADGGATWRFLDAKSSHVDWCAADWTGSDFKFVLALKHESGGLLLASRDGGTTFAEVGKGYGPGWVFDGKTAVVAEAKAKDRPKPNLLRTTDGGRTWRPCGSYSPVGVNSAQALPKWHGRSLYWLVEGALIASDDQGSTWKKAADVKDGRYGPVFGKDAKQMFVLTGAGVIESIDGGATWSKPILPPKDLKGIDGLTWLAYDPKNDVLYLMKMGSDLFKLARGRSAIR